MRDVTEDTATEAAVEQLARFVRPQQQGRGQSVRDVFGPERKD